MSHRSEDQQQNQSRPPNWRLIVLVPLTLAFAALTIFAGVKGLWGVLVLGALLTMLSGFAAAGMRRGKLKAGPVELTADFAGPAEDPTELGQGEPRQEPQLPRRSASTAQPQDPPPGGTGPGAG